MPCKTTIAAHDAEGAAKKIQKTLTLGAILLLQNKFVAIHKKDLGYLVMLSTLAVE
jgi:hypothetical protein